MDTISTIALKRPLLRSFGTVLMAALEGLELRLQRQRSRRDLLELTDDQLKDIGLSRCDAHCEGYRPLWD